jgi:FHA domain-containing protein
VITLSVISYNGSPGDGRLSASFDELGGTIGRADTNQLVLPDPDRAISRVHAQVVYRAGSYAILDRGSNPIQVNGQPVGNGREMPIRKGDQVQIGGFLLGVTETPGKTSADGAAGIDDPFAGLLGPAAASRGAAASAPAALVDPLAAFGFAEPSRPGFSSATAYQPPAPTPLPGASPAPASASGIPDDWDPFAPDAVSARPAAPDFAQSLGRRAGAGQFGLDSGSAAPAPLIGDLPSGGGNDNSLDALFGLKPGSGGGDPLANSVLDAPMSKPNMAASDDPLKSLGAAPLASAAAAQDNLSDLQQPFFAPPAVDSRPAPLPAPAPAGAAPVAPAVFSWDAPEGDGHTVIRPAARVAAAAPTDEEGATRISALPVLPETAPVFVAAPVAVPAPLPTPTATPTPTPTPTTPAPAPAPAASAPASADVAALLAAFREGLDLPSLKLESLTPELMRLIGLLLHESARGTVDLLVARAALKREVRAEATMIVARENNPLKFSPSAEAALQHLLSPPMRGFMPPGPAMRDAFDDLRAHQFGFIAGMRAALAGVLQRFRPTELEGRLTQRSGLKSLLPGSRKAAMWDVFTEHYAQISRDAEDDFHSLFGKAFLQAYEEHIAQLRKEHD